LQYVNLRLSQTIRLIKGNDDGAEQRKVSYDAEEVEQLDIAVHPLVHNSILPNNRFSSHLTKEAARGRPLSPKVHLE
jgi:hypothetical protein